MEEKKVMPADNNEEKITTNEVDNCISSDAENSEERVKKITRIKVKKFFKNIFVLIVIAIAIFCALLALDKYKNVFEGKALQSKPEELLSNYECLTAEECLKKL